MKLLWWHKEKKPTAPVDAVDAGGFTKEFYANQRLEMAKEILTAPSKAEAEKIIEQFKLAHPGEWIENDDSRNYLPSGKYQGRPLTLDDIGKYFVGTVDNGSYVRREIEMVVYHPDYGFIPCSHKYRTPLDILSYRGIVGKLADKMREENKHSKRIFGEG